MVILFREIATRYREPLIRTDAFWTVLGFVGQITIGGALSIAIGRHYGPEIKGYASLLNIGPSIAAWLLAMGIGPATMYFANSKRIHVSELLSGGSVLAVVFGTVAAIAGWLILRPMVGDPNVVVALAIGLILTIVQLVREYHGSALLGLKYVTLYAQTSLLGRLAGALLLLPSVYLAPLPVFYLLIPISVAMTNAVVIAAVARAFRWQWRWSQAAVGRMLRFGLHSHAGDAIVVSLVRLDQFVVFWLLGATALGLYSVAALCSDFLGQAGQAAGYLFFGRISGAGHRGPHLARLATTAAALGLLLLAIPLALIADPLLVSVFGPGFGPAVHTWQLLAAAGAVDGAGRVAVLALRALGAPLRASFAYFAGLVVKLPLAVALGLGYGLEGVAFATLLANTVIAIGAYLALRRPHDGPTVATA